MPSNSTLKAHSTNTLLNRSREPGTLCYVELLLPIMPVITQIMLVIFTYAGLLSSCISPTMQTLQLPESIKREHYAHMLEAKWVRGRWIYVSVLE